MSNADASGGVPPRDAVQLVPHEVDVDQAFDVDGLYSVRATVAAHASHVGATESDLEALVIIASELATNAIRHGGGSGVIQVWHDDEYIYVQVTDQGSGIADPTMGNVLPDPQRVGGRGMWIVRNLSHTLLVRPGPTGRGTCVTAQVRRRDPTSVS